MSGVEGVAMSVGEAVGVASGLAQATNKIVLNRKIKYQIVQHGKDYSSDSSATEGPGMRRWGMNRPKMSSSLSLMVPASVSKHARCKLWLRHAI